MLEKPPLGLFVVGTDTSVGKTYVTCRLAETLRREGRKVGVYKPAESGWEDPDDPRSDAHRLWEAAGRVGTIDEVCPMRLKTPIAPHLAAAAEGRVWDRRLIRSGLSVWKGRCDIVLVEGAGGLLSPLGDDESVIDLAAEFGYPLLLVGADHVCRSPESSCAGRPTNVTRVARATPRSCSSGSTSRSSRRSITARPTWRGVRSSASCSDSIVETTRLGSLS